jgi:hypothetical protein
MNPTGRAFIFVGAVGLLFCAAAFARYALVMIFAAGFAASAGDRGFVDEVTLSAGTVTLGLASLAGIAFVFALAHREKPTTPTSPPAPVSGGFVLPKMT